MHRSPSPLDSLKDKVQQRSEFRATRLLPPPLLDHCTVYLEEQLYSQAFSLLSSALTSGTGTPLKACVPPPSYLALAATLLVHPHFTTRTTSPDKRGAANDALWYLRHLLRLTGPRNSGFCEALGFQSANGAERGKRSRARHPALTPDHDNQPDAIRSVYAGNESLYSNASDFWAAIGWAFNCSVAHKHRWERWKLWLELTLDVLRDDLEARVPAAEKAFQEGGTPAVRAVLANSLLARYLSPVGEGRNNKRPMMRAMLADGSPQRLAEFPEIWRHETRPPKKTAAAAERRSKRRKLDLENGEFGDYLDDASDENSPASALPRSRSTSAFPSSAHPTRSATPVDSDPGPSKPASPQSTDLDAFGGPVALRLRKRLLALLTYFCAVNPDAFLDLEDLFDLYTEFLRPLPLPIFQSFITPTAPTSASTPAAGRRSNEYLAPNHLSALCQMLLRPLLAATLPPYSSAPLTVEEFVARMAAHAANNANVGDNARVSLLVESLLRGLWDSGQLKNDDDGAGGGGVEGLRAAVEKGIVARREKVAVDGRRRGGAGMAVEEEAQRVLAGSGERMRLVLDCICMG